MGLVGFWVRPTCEPLYDGVTGSTLFIGSSNNTEFNAFIHSSIQAVHRRGHADEPHLSAAADPDVA